MVSDFPAKDSGDLQSSLTDHRSWRTEYCTGWIRVRTLVSLASPSLISRHHHHSPPQLKLQLHCAWQHHQPRAPIASNLYPSLLLHRLIPSVSRIRCWPPLMRGPALASTGAHWSTQWSASWLDWATSVSGKGPWIPPRICLVHLRHLCWVSKKYRNHSEPEDCSGDHLAWHNGRVDAARWWWRGRFRRRTSRLLLPRIRGRDEFRAPCTKEYRAASPWIRSCRVRP